MSANTFRVVKRRFVAVDRRTVRDDRLSFRAFGILAYLLDRPDDWQWDSVQLSRGEGREGREAIRTALRELEECGYVVRHKFQDDAGRWATDTTVYEVPPGVDGDPTSADPEDDVETPPAQETDAQKPDFGSPGAIRKTDTKNNPVRASQTHMAAVPDREDLHRDSGEDPAEPRRARKKPAYHPEFAEWFAAYPRRRVGKQEASVAYWTQRRNGATREELLAAAVHYGEAMDAQRVDDHHRLHAVRFLRLGRWRDYVDGDPEADARTGTDSGGWDPDWISRHGPRL